MKGRAAWEGREMLKMVGKMGGSVRNGISDGVRKRHMFPEGFACLGFVCVCVFWLQICIDCINILGPGIDVGHVRVWQLRIGRVICSMSLLFVSCSVPWLGVRWKFRIDIGSLLCY